MKQQPVKTEEEKNIFSIWCVFELGNKNLRLLYQHYSDGEEGDGEGVEGMLTVRNGKRTN